MWPAASDYLSSTNNNDDMTVNSTSVKSEEKSLFYNLTCNMDDISFDSMDLSLFNESNECDDQQQHQSTRLGGEPILSNLYGGISL